MTRYDITYEYRIDIDGHELAGFVTCANIIEAAQRLQRTDFGSDETNVEVRYLAEIKRSTCCQRGDWAGADHQPASAYVYVPRRQRLVFRGETKTTFLAETTADYRWECEYCGRTGTAAQLDPSR